MQYFCPKHFRPEEFVPPQVFADLKERSLLVMDYRILKTAEAVRTFFGASVTICNWVWGGKRTLSGFRPPETSLGALYSQHKFGRAIDCIIRGVPAQEAREAISSHRERFPYVTVVERDVSWLHVDCRAITGTDEVVWINP
jgi:hypothetical protein